MVGATNPAAISPDNWTLDQALLDRPGMAACVLDLLEDYKTNVAAYASWQEAFRRHQPKTLIVWGRHDPFFVPAGAEAYRRDLPEARLVWLESGHFVLDENASRVAAEIKADFAGSATISPQSGTKSDPTDTVRGFYDRLSAGDAPGALGLLADDVEWTTMWHYRVDRTGPEAVADGLFRPLMAEWSSFALHAERFIADGETVVSLGRFTGTHAASGKSVDAAYAHVWTVRDGRIARFRQYIDTKAVAEARI